MDGQLCCRFVYYIYVVANIARYVEEIISFKPEGHSTGLTPLPL